MTRSAPGISVRAPERSNRSRSLGAFPLRVKEITNRRNLSLFHNELVFDNQQRLRLPYIFPDEVRGMKTFRVFCVAAMLTAAATVLHADDAHRGNAVVVTASNTAANQIMVYNTAGQLLQSVPTQGQ